MKHLLGAVFFICLSAFSLKAQNYSIKGTVKDTSALAALQNASISVLRAKDSILVKYTRANPDGAFAIDNLKSGKYLLLLTYPKYADFVESFTLDSARQSLNFGQINMVLKSKLLADVIVKGQVAAIKIKGDTTEYNAASFKIEANSKVEDLLRQLPGIQVDKDGKITAQGEKVNKVLVDGEEFFGDDPTLVTKNLRGDMVDKVQLFDKKSDQATFTGIDDGVRSKTLNIKLKEDKKKGYFGKVDGGSANGEFYEGQAMFNAFKAKQKVSAYTTIANTGKTGLSWEDGNKYGASANMEFSEGGDMMFTGNREDLNYNGQGIPSAATGGAHYDRKWNNDKESINVNYKVGSLSIDGQRSNLTQTTLPTGVFNSSNLQNFHTSTFRQKFDATYQVKIDSSTSLKVILEGTLKSTKAESGYQVFGTRGDNSSQNNSTRDLSNDGKQESVFASAFFSKKLKKKGRTYSLNLSQSFNRDEDEGFLLSQNNYFNKLEMLDSTRIINQRKDDRANNSALNSNLTYTEPLSKTLSLILNLGVNFARGTSDRKSFNQNLNGDYNQLDSAFSNNFELNRTTNHGGAVLNYKKGKAIVNLGAKFTDVNNSQLNNYTGVRYERSFLNVNPQASYQYKFSQQRSVSFNYNGTTTQPSLNQLQPIRLNTDPLNISLGNLDLKPAFGNSINANYRSYKVMTNQYMGGYANYSFTVNSIASNTVTDSAGRSTYSFLNISDKITSNFNIRGDFDQKIKALGFNVGFGFALRGNKNYNYINNVLNTLRSNSYSVTLNVSKYVAKKYGFWGNVGPTYNTYNSSLQTRINNNAGGLKSFGNFFVHLPKKFEISSNFEYTLTRKTETFNQDVNYFIWNTTFSKKFFKDESLKLSASGNDLLNQNIGFRRNAFGNSISQNSYTTIKRYFLVSLLWDFNKMGGGLKSKN